MFRRNLSVLLAAIALAGPFMMPVKKAQAGVLIGGAGGIGLALTGVAYGALCGPNCILGSSLNALVIGLIILDEDERPTTAFDTIPPYLLQEVQDQVLLKAEAIEPSSSGLKDVVFTHAEVDVLFELADGDTSQDQLDNLRHILTTSSL